MTREGPDRSLDSCGVAEEQVDHSQVEVVRPRRGAAPTLSFLIPGSAENRWSDLLATLVATDPAPLEALLGVTFTSIRREVTIPGRRADRLDVLLERDGTPVAAIEAKLLSDLGPRQLDRYLHTFPVLESYSVLHLQRLPVDLQRHPRWASLTWEKVLDVYTTSANAWVRATARAWIGQLDALVPPLDGQTIWNEVTDTPSGMELDLRARIAWLATQADSWCELDHDMAPSSGGGSWAVRLWATASNPTHAVTAELQEGMTAYEWQPDPNRPYRDRLRGPVILVGLRLADTDTSEHFDWALLHRMFSAHVLDATGKRAGDGRPWQTTSARPKHPIDRQHWLSVVEDGAPTWLGKGWGMKVAQGPFHECMFGARIELPATATLHEVDRQLRGVETLVRDLAATI